MNASCMGDVILLARKRQLAEVPKENHFGRWWPFCQYPLYTIFLSIQAYTRGLIIVTISHLYDYSRRVYS